VPPLTLVPVGVSSPAHRDTRRETMTKNAFDLSSIDTIAACNKPVDIEIEHPVSREKLGVFIQVVGKDSDIYRDRIRALANENMARDAFNARRGKQEVPDIAKMEAKNIDVLVAATVGWKGVVLNSEELAFSAENARKVYQQILPVREQVTEAINDLENFMH